ncbi:DUF443 family protein [Enterococcus ureilyticus]|uniref:DUF443 family protein n=1 Tax=Enterococcus ureilyticus TaxID=1131292 RepID=UPI0023E865B4|nr:DUF443 family protein [Enterococcus ureilyticus]
MSRYKLAILNEKRYLIDMDTNKLIWFFPMIIWLSKLEAVEITKDQYNLLKRDSKYSASTGINIAAIGLGGVVYSFLKGVIDIVFQTATVSSLIISFLVIVMIAFILRYIVSLVNMYQLKNYEINQKSVGYIQLAEKNPYYKKICLQSMFIFLGVYFLLLYLYLAYLEAVVLVILLILSFALFFLNTLVVKPYSDMSYKYIEYGK